MCGGISNNDFILEMISSLTNCMVIRGDSSEMSVRGAAYMAGLGAGKLLDVLAIILTS